MKKAKEFAAEFKADPSNETLGRIAMDFIFEIEELQKKRHAQGASAFVAIFNEQDRKWKTFAKLVKGIRPDGFERLVKEKLPSAHVLWRGPLKPESVTVF